MEFHLFRYFDFNLSIIKRQGVTKVRTFDEVTNEPTFLAYGMCDLVVKQFLSE